ncbi:hypothetical protein, partial [Aquimarina agarilytica]|uniref:hypothetical protein n=1 Tax=Aquimarina agarilytica TaxID=1087449 RepID=UPI0002882899
MANSGITMREKENPPRVKEEYSITRITIRPKNPNVKVMPAAQKPAILKHKKPLVKELKGPYNKNGDLVLNVLAGETYTYKATKFEESTFTPIKHIWFAEQLDNGEIIDLEYNRGVNPYMDKDNEKYVCYDYTIPENVSEVRIYAYCWKPTQSESIVSKVKSTVVFYIGGASDKEGFYGSPATEIVKDDVADPFLKLIKQNKLDKSYQSFYLGYNEVR